MRHVFILFKRELGAYFLGPMAYLLLVCFPVLALLNFWMLVDVMSDPTALTALSGTSDPLNRYISESMGFWIAMLVAIPALTMRLFAEERRSGTIETVLTSPVTETEIVLAKWLAAVVMYLSLLAPFYLYLPFLVYFGKYSLDYGPIVSLSLTLVTAGMMFTAIGVFFSSTTKNQIVAAIATFVTLFVLIVMLGMAHEQALAARREELAEALRYLSVLYQLHWSAAGRLDLRFLALHLSVATIALYLTSKQLRFGRDV